LGGGPTIRHDIVCAAGVACFRDAQLVVHSHYHIRGSGTDQPDTTVYGLPSATETSVVEYSITSPFQDNLLHSTSECALYAATAREREKLAKYRALANAKQCKLFAAVMESTGAFGKGLQHLLTLASAAHDRHEFAAKQGLTWTSNSFKRFWTQRLAVAFWQGTHSMHLAQNQRRQELQAQRQPSRDQPSRRMSSQEINISPCLSPTSPAPSQTQQLFPSSPPSHHSSTPVTRFLRTRRPSQQQPGGRVYG
jgi:hypothetical protein